LDERRHLLVDTRDLLFETSDRRDKTFPQRSKRVVLSMQFRRHHLNKLVTASDKNS
jgi:hypothetical protein